MIFFSNLRSIIFASDMVIYGYIFHNLHFLYFIALTIIQPRTNDEEIKIMTIFTLCILFYLNLLILLLFFLIFFIWYCIRIFIISNMQFIKGLILANYIITFILKNCNYFFYFNHKINKVNKFFSSISQKNNFFINILMDYMYIKLENFN